MQEEISKKVIVFTVTLTKVGGRMTAKALKAAMRKYLDDPYWRKQAEKLN